MAEAKITVVKTEKGLRVKKARLLDNNKEYLILIEGNFYKDEKSLVQAIEERVIGEVEIQLITE
jgi:hypothetical protein